ncbi:MAG: hypothetical protein ACFCUI_03225 [Bernardetiaceae bacterium]
MSHAQSTLNDPLKKPAIWKALEENPADEGLWYQYMGKEESKMSQQQYDQFIGWRQELLLRLARRNSAARAAEQARQKARADSIALVQKQAEEEKLKNPYQGKSAAEIKALLTQEALIMEESDELTELKGNLYVNFDILEEKYKAEFQRLGQTYQPYHDVYPDESYPHVRWCEDQEKRLRALKEAKVRALRLNN